MGEIASVVYQPLTHYNVFHEGQYPGHGQRSHRMKPLRLNHLSVLLCAFALTADLSLPPTNAQSTSQLSKPSSTEAGGEITELPDTLAGKALGEFIRAFNT